MFVALDGALQKRARNILRQFPHLAKQDRTRPDADPFVIALAMETGARLDAVDHGGGPNGVERLFTPQEIRELLELLQTLAA